MQKIMNRDTWEKACEGFVFTEVALREGKIACLLTRADLTQEQVSEMDDSEIPTRVLIVYDDGQTEYLKCGAANLGPFSQPILGVSLKPLSQGLVLSNEMNGPVLPIGGGKDSWPIELLEEGNFPLCNKIKCIDGYAWAVGGRRQVYKRVDMNNWSIINNGLNKEGRFSDIGFSDLDGFSNEDIYAVGGKGDIWHYDGNIWEPHWFPTNMPLDVVCCADDGNVYIGSRYAIWKGRDNTWEKIVSLEDISGQLKAARWFKGRLWLTHDYGILIWDGKTLKDEVIYQNKRLPLQGKMDANKDYLMIVNLYAAWTFDGTHWCEIIPPYDIYDEQSQIK